MPAASMMNAARMVLTALLGAALIYMVLCTAQWNGERMVSRSGLGQVLPEAPDAIFASMFSNILDGKQPINKLDLALVDQAAALDPIDARPFLFHAFKQIAERGEAFSAIPLLETARHYNPRSREARLVLFDAYVKGQRVTNGFREAESLARQSPMQTPQIAAMLTVLSTSRGMEREVAAALPRSSLRGEVVIGLAQGGVDAPTIFTLASGMRGVARKGDADGKWAGEAVDRLLQRGDAEGARLLWSLLDAIPQADVGRVLSDGDFKGVVGTSPFGWRLRPGTAGLSEIRDGKLEVYFYGKEKASFAEQALMLPPGQYRLISSFNRKDGEGRPGLEWELICAGSNDAFASLALGTGTASASETGFVVPAQDCAAQTLRLIGFPQEMEEAQSLSVDRVAIVGSAAP